MDIKSAIFASMKNKDLVQANILRVVLSESERTGKTYEKTAEKLIESNNEILKHKSDEKLVRENQILAEFIPKKMTRNEIFSLLSQSRNDIITQSEGKAIGIAMKVLKEKDLNASSEDVRFVVKSLRESLNA